MTGYTWDGAPGAPITNRILWLEGLEPGRNQGGSVDTFARYIYIHGTGDEPSLGQPASRGCIHVAGSDLLPLYDVLPLYTLVWIE
jgi:lipoprotein-anchoring transpeptidase ErfK/SrfK